MKTRLLTSFIVTLLTGTPGWAGQSSTRPATGPAADDAESATESPPFWHDPLTSWVVRRPHLPDLQAARKAAEEKGLSIETTYTADYILNTRGGINTNRAQEYLGLLNMTLGLDTEKLGLWKGGTATVVFHSKHGPDPSERHIGDLQGVDNIACRDITQVSEYWYQQSFLDGAFRVKFGKMDAWNDFGHTDNGSEFLNYCATWSPNVLYPTYPDPALGVAIFAEPVEWFYAGAGLYDAEGLGGKWGFSTAFHAPDDHTAVAEIGVKPAWKVRGGELPGRYAVGGWYNSAEWPVAFNDLRGRLRPRFHHGNHGFYLTLDQLLYKERPGDEEDEQGLGAFFEFGWAPSPFNEIHQHYGVGLAYTGLLPSRDEDTTGLMVSHVNLSDRVQDLEDRSSETVIEWFYGIQITPSVSLKPDLQYIVNPGGGSGRDSLVFGLRVELSL